MAAADDIFAYPRGTTVLHIAGEADDDAAPVMDDRMLATGTPSRLDLDSGICYQFALRLESLGSKFCNLSYSTRSFADRCQGNLFSDLNPTLRSHICPA